jgi:hypothetical protein
MYFTGLQFLITVSRGVSFITASLLTDQKKSMILTAIQQVIHLYQGRGHEIKKLDFKGKEESIHTILADNEFSGLKESGEEWGIDVHIVSKQEHVPEVERQNRSSRKEREESYKHFHTESCQRK